MSTPHANPLPQCEYCGEHPGSFAARDLRGVQHSACGDCTRRMEDSIRETNGWDPVSK